LKRSSLDAWLGVIGSRKKAQGKSTRESRRGEFKAGRFKGENFAWGGGKGQIDVVLWENKEGQHIGLTRLASSHREQEGSAGRSSWYVQS